MNKRNPFEFTRSSWILLSVFLVIIVLIMIVWQPLVRDYLAYFDPAYPWWMQVDWLLIGIFLFMSVLITLGADIRSDWLLVVVGFCGGAVIETWGTHAGLWAYYTGEKPPLWILPAWPIAALCIERMVRVLPASLRTGKTGDRSLIYWATMAIFTGLMAVFLWRHGPSWMDVLAFVAVLVLIALPGDKRTKLLIFLAGAALGVFLEYWGTSRECWVYYTHEVPPLFAIFAHGMASVAFWQVCQWVRWGMKTVLNEKLGWKYSITGD